jgi:hypothetical protein
MARIKVLKPAIQDQPVSFTNLTVSGIATFNGTVILDGTVTGSAVPSISPYQSLVANSILPYQGSNNIVSTVKNSVIGGGRFNDISAGSDYGGILGGEYNLLQHARSFILGANITSSAANTTFVENMNVSGHISSSGFTNVGSTSTTLSSSFTTTLNFSTNRIMSVTTGSALTMSIDAGNSILGNVIMTDISSSVGLNLPSSEFKVLNGTFDTTKRNYVYYHYIGNDTALVTINQES